MEDNSKFIKKQNRLNKALKKIEDHLKYLEDKYHGNKEVLRDDREWETWNDWHDLQERIERRLIDNYHEAQQWHFEKFGWVAIN